MPARCWPLLRVLRALSSCAGREARELGEPRAARQVLARQAATGAIPLTLLGLPEGLTPGRVATLAADGVRGLSVSFSPEASGALRLVLWFDAPAAAIRPCAEDAGMSTNAGSRGRMLVAAYCDGTEAIAVAQEARRADSARAVERSVWMATSRLFPDDYPETYGIDLFGLRVRLGGSVAF